METNNSAIRPMLRLAVYLTLPLWVIVSAKAQSVSEPEKTSLKGIPFNNVTLETSLKPFKKNDKKYIKQVATEMFTQWKALLRHADTVSIMLWTSDGSEILDYRGTLKQPLEWAKYIGNPNTAHEVGSGPKELSLHERAYLYIDNPPSFTYGDLKNIIKTLKEVGKSLTGKYIRIGATFDPGPEFAKSDFKYKRHREILGGNAMGAKTFVSCYAILNADRVSYAGFPKGIPANTTFGTFFGRQSQHFLKDLGYDYIWFSNGFGFGVEGWSSTGAIFNGKGFQTEKLPETKAKIINFWDSFRKECPTYRIETRGTNLSTGADLARDGVDLNTLYKGKYNFLPPPNSPWAAMDGDFGLELVGYMSRIAELPDNRYVFRYYTHDPWWVNSPWLDRYGREPHDIYMPLSVSRIDSKGDVKLPTHLNFLTIDNSYGEMPTQVPDEVIPNILKARYDSPTAPGPLVWVYPFEEYHRWAYDHPERLSEMYFGDWYMRQAINEGFPLNTVISTSSLPLAIKSNPGLFNQSILVSIVPDAGSVLEKCMIDFVKNGGKLIVYGPANHASRDFKALLNLELTTGLTGIFSFSSSLTTDQHARPFPKLISHQMLSSGGGLDTKLLDPKDEFSKVLLKMEQQGQSRAAIWSRSLPSWKGGKVVYLRGTNSSNHTGSRLLTSDQPNKYFIAPTFLRYVLEVFGMQIFTSKETLDAKTPVLSISNSNNGLFFSGYVPNTTVSQKFRFDYGAPIFSGLQTKLVDGFSTYNLPTSWHRECRVFVQQQEGILSCKEVYSGKKGISKRMSISGLMNATVRIFPENGVKEEDLEIYLNVGYPYKTGRLKPTPGDPKYGKHYVIENVTGSLITAW